MGSCMTEKPSCIRNKKNRQPENYPMTSSVSSHSSSAKITQMFEKFDKNHDGYLELSEVIQLIKYTALLSSGSSCQLPDFFYKDAAENLIHQADKSEEGKISKSDFYKFYL